MAKILELFAGSRSFVKVAKKYGHETFCTDIVAFDKIDYVCDILDFDYNKVPFKPDIIWASPPCTCFSVASISKHWTGGIRQYTPKTEEARNAIKLVEKTIEIINYYKPKYWYIENPRCVLRKMKCMKKLPVRYTITYCQYGDKRMKPTDIWTNDLEWRPRPTCKNNASCHEPAPRGSKTGTQGLKDSYERAIVPEQLCIELIERNSIKKVINKYIFQKSFLDL